MANLGFSEEKEPCSANLVRNGRSDWPKSRYRFKFKP
ncbi:hypothetical protein Prudu_004779 [Prunus dulcis]|uniref:Uncharacterized protein n=1 Tax=Prunus dulcis TaxID=3755 RepID=A0A4Y1QW71_PRUDU|nr:hypothetical protein Prudu_004779 [Prunus dulcis]